MNLCCVRHQLLHISKFRLQKNRQHAGAEWIKREIRRWYKTAVYTGRLIMFSVITNIYNKKTKGPTLMELFTATGKLSFLGGRTTRDVRCVIMGDTAHIDTIFKFLPQARQNGCFLLAQTPSFSKLFIPRKNGLVCRRVLSVLCMKCTLHSNHRLTRVIFQHTKRLVPQSGHFLTTLATPSGRNVNYDEKQLTGEKSFELFLLAVEVS